MSESAIKKAIGVRHSGDVVVFECKNGPTHTASHRRMDAWILMKTWSPITTLGYEIKMSRADWRRDDKLGQYAGMCHLLYIAAPKGIVPIDEIPSGVGLVEFVGDRLITRRKATRLEIDVPATLLVYVLMCRAKIDGEGVSDNGRDPRHGRVDALREWVQQKSERRQLHYAISQKVQEQFRLQERHLSDLERRLSELTQIESRMRELGFDPAASVNSWQVTSRLEKIGGIISTHMLSRIKRTSEDLLNMQRELEAMRAAPIEGAEQEV